MPAECSSNAIQRDSGSEDRPAVRVPFEFGRLPDGVAEHLGFYVYLYIDPRDGRVFYVGKGKGDRVLDHLSEQRASEKTETIADIRRSGCEPRLEILAHGLKDEETAFRVEAAAIDLMGLGELTNKVRGWKSLQTGRMTLDELAGYYAAKPVTVTDPVLLIRINKLYQHGMSETALYEATRGIWRVGKRRETVKYAFAVFEGVVREVYRIDQWHPARSTPYSTRDLSERDVTGRWEFTGERAEEKIRGEYRLGSVRQYWSAGNQNPILYVVPR